MDYKTALQQAVSLVLDTIRLAMKAEKKRTFQHARERIDDFIYFYNHERIQLKTGETPLAQRLSA